MGTCQHDSTQASRAPPHRSTARIDAVHVKHDAYIRELCMMHMQTHDAIANVICFCLLLKDLP